MMPWHLTTPGVFWKWQWLVALWLGVALVAMPALAQDDEEFVAAEIEPEGEAENTDFTVVDDLLARDEAALTSPETLTYEAGARRDPFRSLIQQRRQRVSENPEQRPEGVAGLLIDEIEVQGVFILDEGPVAQIQSPSEETSFLLRPGDQLWDGDVVSISFEEIVFKQTVNDPTALKPFREVVKRLD